MEEILYKINKLKCAYDGESIVLEIDELEIPQNKVVFIVGSSGVGKSTILETLGLMNNTIVSVDKFCYKGQDLSQSWKWSDVEMSNFRNKEFSFVFQQNNLMPNFSAHDNIITAALFQGEDERIARKKTMELLRVLEFEDVEDRSIVEYSGGQKQRLALARAVLPSFTVLFGDEPTGNLDPKTARSIMKMMVNLTREKGATVILASHDMNLAVEFADEIIQIKKKISPNDEKKKSPKIGYIDEQCKYKRKGDSWYNNEFEFTKEELSLKLVEDL